jgi:hypothetical protein
VLGISNDHRGPGPVALGSTRAGYFTLECYLSEPGEDVNMHTSMHRLWIRVLQRFSLGRVWLGVRMAAVRL